jgi:hypothetical protein
VLLPRVMRCVPVREALSAITRVDAREVGGFGAAGIVEALLEDDISIFLSVAIATEAKEVLSQLRSIMRGEFVLEV